MLNQCNLVELFSGIGSQVRALENLGIKVNTLGTSEWDIHAICAYDVIHNSVEIPDEIAALDKTQLLEILKQYTFSNSGKEALDYASFRTYSVEVLRRIYASISRSKNFVDISQLNGTDLPDGIDILTYSFPCQDLSNVGAFHGYNKGIDKDSGSRSSLIWQVGRILTEMKDGGKQLPRFLLMENVPTLLSERHRENFETWIDDLGALGYISKYYQLNAVSFGLPQNRPRLLMISVFIGNNSSRSRLVKEFFEIQKDEAAIVADYCASDFYNPKTVSDLLRTDYKKQALFAEAVECTPNDTVSRQKIWDENPQIVKPDGTVNLDIDAIRTITTKQDRNPNSGNLYFESGIEGRSKFRYLTPRECLLFMGFNDADYDRIKNSNIEFHKGDAVFARDKVIRMAGNSIPVKLLEGIFYQIMQLDELLNEHEKHIQQNLFGEVLEEDFSAIIRKYMFGKGIRSRKNSSPVPQGATVVYPAHKTAIFVRDCFDRTHDCRDMSQSSLVSRAFWKKQTEKIRRQDQQQYDDTLSMGWKAVVVWKCQLNKSTCEKTLAWIESRIRMPASSEECKEVMYYG